MTSKQVVQIHKVICDSSRFDIIQYLKFHKDVTTDELIKYIGCDASTLSFHLTKLQQVKAITVIKKGKNKIYNINSKTLDETSKFMGDLVQRARDNYTCTPFTKKEILRTFELYSDDSRINILNIIIEHQGCTGKDIKILTGESEANISFHIKKLIEGNVIYDRKKDNQHYYLPNIQYLACFHGYFSKARNKDVWQKKKKCDCGC